MNECMDGTKEGSSSTCHPSGWIQTGIFTKWFDHFVNFFKPSAYDPVLLTVYGHYSHTKNIDVVDKAREHTVATVSLLPHSTHKMQPFDVDFLKPLKTYYAQETETGLGNNPGRIVTFFLLCKLLGSAYRSGSVHRKYIPIYIQQDATLHSLFISGNCSTCFGWYFHSSSGAHTTVSTVSGICHTVTAICRYRGKVRNGLSVLWVAYATHSTLPEKFMRY
jgi:hypothetical protein